MLNFLFIYFICQRQNGQDVFVSEFDVAFFFFFLVNHFLIPTLTANSAEHNIKFTCHAWFLRMKSKEMCATVYNSLSNLLFLVKYMCKESVPNNKVSLKSQKCRKPGQKHLGRLPLWLFKSTHRSAVSPSAQMKSHPDSGAFGCARIPAVSPSSAVTHTKDNPPIQVKWTLICCDGMMRCLVTRENLHPTRKTQWASLHVSQTRRGRANNERGPRSLATYFHKAVTSTLRGPRVFNQGLRM